MKARQPTELNQPRHDHLDVHIRGVMPKIDKAQRLGPKLPGAVETGSPIIDHRGVKRGFIQLMFEENAPAIRQRLVDDLHAFEITLQSAPVMDLAGEIPAVGDPDRQRFGTEYL